MDQRPVRRTDIPFCKSRGSGDYEYIVCARLLIYRLRENVKEQDRIQFYISRVRLGGGGSETLPEEFGVGLRVSKRGQRARLKASPEGARAEVEGG